MVKGNLGRLMMRGGVTLAAALMMSTAAFAQDEGSADAEPAVSIGVVVQDGDVQTWHDLNPGDEGIAVGEPDPYGEGEPDIVIDDGYVIGDDPVDDGSGGDDGADDGWVDDGSDDDGSDDWADDGSDDDLVDDGSDGGWVDDGSDNGWVDGGEVVIDYLDGGPVLCADCEVSIADLPMEAYQTSAGMPLAAEGDAPVAAKPRRKTSHAFAVGPAAECLAAHPQLPWICEWQNGAGQ